MILFCNVDQCDCIPSNPTTQVCSHDCVHGMLIRTIYLGETFCSYISVGNKSDHAVSAVGIKVCSKYESLMMERSAPSLDSTRKILLDAGLRCSFEDQKKCLIS